MSGFHIVCRSGVSSKAEWTYVVYLLCTTYSTSRYIGGTGRRYVCIHNPEATDYDVYINRGGIRRLSFPAASLILALADDRCCIAYPASHGTDLSPFRVRSDVQGSDIQLPTMHPKVSARPPAGDWRITAIILETITVLAALLLA